MIAERLLEPVAFAHLVLASVLGLTAAVHAAAPSITNVSPGFGTVGATVTIYGNNFGGTKGSSAVKFNGKTATVVSGGWSNTKIVVTVPGSATTGFVTITVSNQIATSTADFNVLATRAALAMGAFPPQSASCSKIAGYNGTNCVGDYRSYVIPNVDGVLIVGGWSAIESSNSMGTGSGGYDWSSLDDAVNTFVGQANWDASKKIGIVLSPATNGDANSGTPAYVYTSSWATAAGASAPLDQCTCSGYPGDSGAPTHNGCWNQSNSSSKNTSGMPAVWEKPFYIALENLYNAAVLHFNSSSLSYAPYIAYVRLGLSTGGEEYPHCSGNLKTLVSPPDNTGLYNVWTDYANTMFTYVGGLGSHYPLMAAPNGNGTSGGVPSDAWADAEAQDALNQGLSLGGEGLQYLDSIATPCSNDWCNTFMFTPAPPIRELQTYAQSDPSQTTCNSSGNYGLNDVDSLTCLLPFVEGRANSVELYPGDLFLSFDPATTGYGTYGSAYASAISNLRTGH